MIVSEGRNVRSGLEMFKSTINWRELVDGIDTNRFLLGRRLNEYFWERMAVLGAGTGLTSRVFFAGGTSETKGT